MSDLLCKGSLSLGTGCKSCRKCFEELEQQLSNSISKDELRGLVDEYNSLPMCCGDFCDSFGESLLASLNELIEGDNNG